jgi:cell fate regulator YaaT (PSP1 superfamily)
MTTNKEIFLKAKSDGKIYVGESGNLDLKNQDDILFENEQGQDVATILSKEDSEADESYDKEAVKVTVIRKLTDKDRDKLKEQEVEALSTIPKCEEKIKKYGLSMSLVNANLSYDGKKLTFYFVAPGRVDFRSLVSDLASTFQKLIRLQQVGSRDKARCVGGIGRCGQEICCKRYLKNELESVTMEMAYDQNLAQMGSNRVTGTCGKLMCCLKYELETYKKAKSKMPELGSEYKTKEGKGIVIAKNVIKNKIKVELPDKRFVEVDC